MSRATPPILSVAPSRALVDEKFRVVVENLPPGAPVTLHSLHQSEEKDYWEAYGHYCGDERGTVSVGDDLSLGGTYKGIEAMGLLWSMRPVPGSPEGLRLRKNNVCTPLLVNISVYSGHLVEGFREQAPLASSLIERWYMAPGVQRVDIRERGVKGTLFVPPGPGPFPGLLDMWGSNGGLVEYRAALLASHGYVALALEYFPCGEMESATTELTYFETAFNLVKEHPQVIPDRIGLSGFSLGTMLTVKVAAESHVAKPQCCVCVSGHHLYPRGWSLGELCQELGRRTHRLRFDENNCVIWRDLALPIPTDLAWKVDVGKINCPLLLLNGSDDQNLSTMEGAEDIAQMMRAAGKEHLLTSVVYPDTGHLIEPPYSPHIRASKYRMNGKQTMMLLLGGQTKPHSDAQEDAWNNILSFLQKHLYS